MSCSKAAALHRAPRLDRLSLRERQLVHHYARGLPNKVVAIDFDISERTAEAHRARIFRKMGVRSALELACSICPHRPRPADEA
jgi:FixJ family two-component response regulator